MEDGLGEQKSQIVIIQMIKVVEKPRFKICS